LFEATGVLVAFCLVFGSLDFSFPLDLFLTMGDSSGQEVVVSSSEVSLSQHAPAQGITSVLLNGRNFAAWSRSLRLYLGGKGKFGWLWGTEKQPIVGHVKRTQWDMDNYTILGCLIIWRSVFITPSCIMIQSMGYGLL
jgi:hypothetical protein